MSCRSIFRRCAGAGRISSGSLTGFLPNWPGWPGGGVLTLAPSRRCSRDNGRVMYANCAIAWKVHASLTTPPCCQPARSTGRHKLIWNRFRNAADPCRTDCCPRTAHHPRGSGCQRRTHCRDGGAAWRQPQEPMGEDAQTKYLALRVFWWKQKGSNQSSGRPEVRILSLRYSSSRRP